MANDTQSIVNKLVRFNKNELVDIIVYRKLPEGLSDCVLLRYIKQSECEKSPSALDSEQVFHDAQESPNCMAPKCALLKQECYFLQQKLDSNDKLITHLEGRINEQIELIGFHKKSYTTAINVNTATLVPSTQRPGMLNKDTERRKPGNAGAADRTRGATATQSNRPITTMAKTIATGGPQNGVVEHPVSKKIIAADEVAISIAQAQALPGRDQSDGPFTEVRNRRGKGHQRINRPITGKNEATTGGLNSGQLLSFLHVYKLHPHTTEVELNNYLKQAFPEVTSEKLNSRYPNYYSSFKVTIHEEHLNTAMDPSFWPKGVLVNRFFHKRKTQDKIR